MFRKLFAYIPVFALVVTALPQDASAQERVRHPRLHAALHELREGRQELKNARDDFGGRRDKALRAIDDAIVSLKLILSVKDDNFRGVDRDPDFYKRYKDHPRLRAALHDLREARDELNDAKADFMGMRERGLRDINYAIDQIRGLIRD